MRPYLKEGRGRVGKKEKKEKSNFNRVVPSVPESSTGDAGGGHLDCGQPGDAAPARWFSTAYCGVGVPEPRGCWWSVVAEMTQAEKGDAENGKEKGGEKEKEQRGVKRPIVPALVPESLQEVRCRGSGLG